MALTKLAAVVTIFIGSLGTSCLTFGQATASSQPTPPEPLVEELRAIRKELQQIHQLLAQSIKLSPQGTTSNVAPGEESRNITLPFVPLHSLGESNAAIAVVEFSDLQCPFCSYFHTNTFPQFKARYVDGGKARFFSVDYPLASHPDAPQLALASICAGEQGRYWEMQDLLMKQQTSEGVSAETPVSALKLNPSTYKACMTSKATLDEMTKLARIARDAGITSTPTFLVGAIINGKIVGKTITGAFPPEEFDSRLDAVIDSLSLGESAALRRRGNGND